jgi:hypothetical protein
VSYFSVTTLSTALARYGLSAHSVDFVDLNGGSYLLTAVAGDEPADNSVRSLLSLEQVSRLNEPAGWSDFAIRVESQRDTLCTILEDYASRGKDVVGFGAAAKTMVMLNYCGIGPLLLHAIGDSNPRKQGSFCPGVDIPVRSPDELFATKPDCVLIGPWNMADEIVSVVRSRGFDGDFVVPLVQPRVLV